jgi:hypothetical protein
MVTEVLDPWAARRRRRCLRATLPEARARLMDAPERTAFEALLGRVGLQAPAFDRFKPWYAAVVLSSLPMISQGLQPQDGAEATLNAYPGGKARTRAGWRRSTTSLACSIRYRPMRSLPTWATWCAITTRSGRRSTA